MKENGKMIKKMVRGKHSYPDGTYYTGYFKNGQRNGQGILSLYTKQSM
jgi:hypothetical protein